MKHLIGKPVELIDSSNRVFGGDKQGIVRSVFTFRQLCRTDLTWYADIDWFDKSYSSFPVNKIRGINMNAIWKFPIRIGTTNISVPSTHRFISANFITDNGPDDFAVWAEVDNSSPSINVDIVVSPTGNDIKISSDWQYINSFRTNYNNLPKFWHVYKILPNRNPENCNV